LGGACTLFSKKHYHAGNREAYSTTQRGQTLSSRMQGGWRSSLERGFRGPICGFWSLDYYTTTTTTTNSVSVRSYAEKTVNLCSSHWKTIKDSAFMNEQKNFFFFPPASQRKRHHHDGSLCSLILPHWGCQYNSITASDFHIITSCLCPLHQM